MKHGVHAALWMKTWQDDVRPYLRTAAELGFDAVELSLLDTDPDALRRIRDTATELGLTLTCTTGLGPDADVTSSDTEVRLAGDRALERLIRTTAELGASLLSGVIYAAWGELRADRREERWDLAASALARAAAIGREHGVVLGVEAINRYETDLVNTAARATALVEAVGEPNVGVLLDAYHMNIEEKDPAAAIRACGDRLVHMHVAGNDRGVPRPGLMDWDGLFSALRTIGYDGNVVLEMFVQADEEVSPDLNVWRDIEPDATEAAERGLTFLKGATR